MTKTTLNESSGRFSRTRLSELDFWVRRALRLDSTSRSWFSDAPLSVEQIQRLHDIAYSIRSTDAPPIAIIHGVMPRSGSNYLNALLGLHPDVVIDPMDVRELPFLPMIPESRLWQERFLDFYRGNERAFGDLELFAYAIHGFLARIEKQYKDAGLIVFKIPHTRYLSYFPALFPKEKCLILLREGQHVVQSTISTWPLKRFGKSFADICREWVYATETALDYWDHADRQTTWLDSFETVFASPEHRIKPLLDFLGLDAGRYPFEKIANLPVLGSSELSKRQGNVSWDPVKADKSFNPAQRHITWTAKQERTFAELATATQKRAGYA